MKSMYILLFTQKNIRNISNILHKYLTAQKLYIYAVLHKHKMTSDQGTLKESHFLERKQKGGNIFNQSLLTWNLILMLLMLKFQ